MGDNADQRAFWSTEVGRQWVANDAALNAHFQPVLDRLLKHAAPKPGMDLLDLGCGTGQTTRAAARAVAPGGSATGIDISAPMIASARAQEGAPQPNVVAETSDAPGLRYLCADAAHHDLGTAQFDLVISRFGAMFFDDPVAGFRNIGAALRPGARMVLACWGPADQNPWFTLPARAARSVLGPVPKTDPDAPGPFAFRDPERVQPILEAAGFSKISAQTETLTIAPPHSNEETARLMADVGPAGGALRHFEASADTRRAVEGQITRALDAHVLGGGLRLPAMVIFYSACWP